MNIHHSETVISKNGTLNLDNLPFKQGSLVEVIIIERSQISPESIPTSLQSKVLYYNEPFESATPLDDWEVLK